MKKNLVIAAIDVGSYALRMKIAEVNAEGYIKILEQINHPIFLGRDTFSYGKINFETIDDTCRLLKGIKNIMKDYRVNTYKMTATSAIREAANRDYILDQIMLKTGLQTEVLSNTEEKFITFRSVKVNLADFEKLNNEGILILDIGSGSIQISICNKGNLVYSQNLKLGSLRLREVLSSLEARTLSFYKLLQEYIDSHVDKLIFLEFKDVCKNYVVLGGEIKTINRLCSKGKAPGNNAYISQESFIELHDELLDKLPDFLVKEFNISSERADLLLPSVMLIKKFMDMTSSDCIYCPPVSLVDGIILDIAHKITVTADDEIKDIITAVKFLAENYKFDKSHAEDVESKALILFDKLKKIHGLGQRERLLLQVAAILHDIGKFINHDEHHLHSYHIIVSSGILALSSEELVIVANIARFHTKEIPDASIRSFSVLEEVKRVKIAKLVALLRLADALDRSHSQKLKNMKVHLDENEIVIKADVYDDVLLEEWAFEKKARFFHDVFGIKPKLKAVRKIFYE